MIRRPPRSTRTAHSFPTRRSSDLRHRGSSTGPRDTAGSALPSHIEEIERAAIQQALQENRYNKTKAAALGIPFRALRYKLKKLGIDRVPAACPASETSSGLPPHLPCTSCRRSGGSTEPFHIPT